MTKSAETTTSPTENQWAAYQSLYDHLNLTFWNGELPHVLLNFSRHANSLGFFAPDAWESGSVKAHEISINPDHLSRREIRQTVSTLVHEMVHLWQAAYGTPSRRGYHNAEWAKEMDRVGLTPSSTGQPGGKRVGQKMTHYIPSDGWFAQEFKRIPADMLLPWRGTPRDVEKKKAKAKTSYVCPRCGLTVWGKRDLALACVNDDKRLTEMTDDEEGADK